MKKIYILVIVMLIGGIAMGQLPISYKFNHRDDISYKGADSGIKTYPWNNGILYLGFCYDSLMSKEGFSITFYDTIGNMLWNKVYYSDLYYIYQANDIVTFNNSSFYIGGIVYKDSINQIDRLFAKFDANGDSVFMKIFPDTEQNWLIDMDIYSSDTILFLCAKTLNDADPYTKTVICKVDTFGNIAYTYESQNRLYIPYQILKATDDIYVGGTRSINLPGNLGYIVKVFIDMYNNDLSLDCIFNPSTTTNEYFSKMFIKNNELYLARDVTVFNPPNQNLFYQCRLSRISLDGFVWQSANFGPANYDGATGTFLSIDSNLLVVQIYSKLYFIDDNLNLLLESNDLCSPNYNRGFGGLSILPNKMIAGTGMYYADTISSQDHWNFLTDNIVNFVATATLKINEIKKSDLNIQIFPNPATNSLTLNLAQLKDIQNSTVSIYDIQGKLLLQQKIMQQQTELNISQFAKGIYIVKVNNDKETVQSKFVKE